MPDWRIGVRGQRSSGDYWIPPDLTLSLDNPSGFLSHSFLHSSFNRFKNFFEYSLARHTRLHLIMLAMIHQHCSFSLSFAYRWKVHRFSASVEPCGTPLEGHWSNEGLSNCKPDRTTTVLRLSFLHPCAVWSPPFPHVRSPRRVDEFAWASTLNYRP